MNYTMTDTLLKLDNVSLSYDKKVVLRDINVEVKDIVSTEQTIGQVITLLGRSGAGKTTLLKIIAGLLKPSAGNVLIGKEQTAVTPGLVGMVLQTYPLFHHRTVMDNLLLVNKDKEKIAFYLNEFDVADHVGKYPKQLSGGQRQRVAIVQQLLTSEHFILFDECYSGLDPVAADKLMINIQKIANLDEQNTIIMSSHILEPALAISDEVWIIGKEQDKEGSTLLYRDDLKAQDLAWHPDIRHESRFTQKVEQIREIFKTI